MTRPGPRISIFGVNERPDRKKPFTVRWSYNGKGHDSPAMASRKEADRWLARLILAVENGGKWNAQTGLPVSWSPVSQINVAQWCRRWQCQEWDGLVQRSRLSIALTLVFLIERSAPAGAPDLSVAQRRELRDWLAPDTGELSAPLAAWVKRWSPQLNDLDGEALHEIDRRMRLRVPTLDEEGNLVGGSLGALTARRQVNTAHQCLDAAVRAHVMTKCDWPKPVKGANRRKKARKAAGKGTGQRRLVFAVESAYAVLDQLPNRQPESWRYKTITAVGFFVGTRPSETVTLEVEDFVLPDEGWGTVSVVRSWNGAGDGWGTAAEDVGDVKTFDRVVPVSPFLVAEVRSYMERFGITSGPLFLNEDGKPPQMTNWRRALANACVKAGVRRLSPYDLRHFAATRLVDLGIKLGRCATLLGHDVETLVRYYLHDTEGSDDEMLELMRKAFGK